MQKKPELKLVKSDNVVNVGGLRKLERHVDRVEHTLTNRGLVTYAYHFNRSGAKRKAEQLLNKLDHDYFKARVYKDLSRALFCWALYKTGNDEAYRKESEYFLVLKNCVTQFGDLKFNGKLYFSQFKNEFANITKSITI